ncbi:MAG: sigma-70 family RNA polymerase sigma factor [Burkholderiales bacterium]|nr:sigma-70 family RNA polymerase sigma factor [Burkholderiales bacterium]
MAADAKNRDLDPHTESLLRATRSGDAVALEDLLTRHYSMVRAFVRLRVDPVTRIRESASDLVQSICREVLRRADEFEYRGEAAFRAWLCEAALRKLHDRRDYYHAQRRDPGREAAPVGDQGWDDLAGVYRSSLDPMGRALRREELEQLEAAFEKLPEEQRQALTLRHLCGIDYGEIAARTGRTEDAVRKLVSRARARLAELLASARAN